MAGRTTGRPFALVAPTNQMHKLDFFPGEHTDIMVLVNFGQSAFKYAPANSYRTPNPCFVGPLVNASFHAFYEDSKELFSMGRIDSQWLNRSTTRGSQYPGTANWALDFDEEFNDWFEFVLDTCGRSPDSVIEQRI